MNLETFAKRTNYQLLLQQKQTLLDLIDPDLLGLKNPELNDHVQGLINFLDSFQDAVVDAGVLPETQVFPLPD